jgi:alcohol dehydrogenase class IV
MSTIHQYNFPTRIQFGPEAIQLLSGVIRESGRGRPLIITDRALVELRPVTGTKKLLEDAGLATGVFSSIWGNPVKSQVTAGVVAYRSHDADCIVALGGGAAIDVAKAVCLMVNHPGDLFDYEDGKPDARPIDRELPLFITVPTTAGTGSEVGRSTVISDDDTKVKKIIFSPRLLAQRVLMDPDLTLGLPATVTAATGMDALTHVVEAFLARGFHPMCDGIALEGLRLLSRNLTLCVDFARQIEGGARELLSDVDHRHARGLVLNAAMMGGVAFQKGLGVTHSMAHALSTVCDLHHGLANGICIPYAMAFNADVVPERMAELAQVVNANPWNANGFVAWLTQIKEAVGIPRSLMEVGVRMDQVPRLVEIAVSDGCHLNNPKPVSDEDFRALFVEALTGAIHGGQ